jgi:hypothetical protein
VPFRGCDTPSERTEFGHSEIALTFTCLSYYLSGQAWQTLPATSYSSWVSGCTTHP